MPEPIESAMPTIFRQLYSTATRGSITLLLRRGLDISAVFTARAGGVLTAIFFLPLYANEMSADGFGIASLALTIQGAVAIADFGIGLLIGRELARHGRGSRRHRRKALRLLVAGERILAGAYGVPLILVGLILVFAKAGDVATTAHDNMTLTLLFVAFTLALVLQHVHNGALVAVQSYWTASGSMALGVILRAILTLFGLIYISSSVELFLVIQILTLIFHYLVTRYFAVKAIARINVTPIIIRFKDYRLVFTTSIPFLILSTSSILATQVDKPILAALRGPESLAIYFLAYSYAQVIISLISAPISQYFMPKIVSAYRSEKSENAEKQVTSMLVTLAIAVIVPGIILFLWAPQIISIWLHSLETADEVATIARLLLLGTSMYAFAFVPYAVLTALDELEFVTRLSLLLGVLFIPGFALAAWLQGPVALAMTAALYQVGFTAGCWVRMMTIRQRALHL